MHGRQALYHLRYIPSPQNSASLRLKTLTYIHELKSMKIFYHFENALYIIKVNLLVFYLKFLFFPLNHVFYVIRKPTRPCKTSFPEPQFVQHQLCNYRARNALGARPARAAGPASSGLRIRWCVQAY